MSCVDQSREVTAWSMRRDALLLIQEISEVITSKAIGKSGNMSVVLVSGVKAAAAVDRVV